MANEENLKPVTKRSKSEAREISIKGGVASGKSRRRKKALRLALKEAVSMRLNELPEDMRTAIMSAVGITDDAQTVADAVIGGMILSACGGSAPMVRLLLDTIGESMEARMREREVKLKERSLDEGRTDSVAPITFIFEREDPE
jgi:ADP-ribosylglycohydrolase